MSKFLIRNLLPEIHQASRDRRFHEWQDLVQEKLAAKEGTGFNKSLPAEQFSGKFWKCLYAGQASSGQFTGGPFS
jgi:hypothetical protein